MSFIFSELQAELAFINTLKGSNMLSDDPTDWKINQVLVRVKDALLGVTNDFGVTENNLRDSIRKQLNPSDRGITNDDDNDFISSLFSATEAKNAFLIQKDDLNNKVVPTQSGSQVVFPGETPAISVYTPDTQGGEQPSYGARVQDTLTFEAILYVVGYEAREVEIRAKIIAQCMRNLIIEPDVDTPLNLWRSGELVFQRQLTETGPIANSDSMTRISQYYTVQKNQFISTL